MEILRSRRRSLVIELHPERGLLVRAPLRMPMTRVEAFLASRKDWIARAQAHLDEQRAKRGPRNYEPGERFGYRGTELELVHESGGAMHRLPCARREGATLRIKLHRAEGLEGEARRQALRRAVVELYRREAVEVFQPKLLDCCQRLGLKPPALRIGHQRRRWGSCSGRSGIRLNLRLLLADEALIDYVVAHEVCHLREMNHGPRFHRLLQSLIPEAPARSARLRREGERYRF